jgi:hypoxanthine phosphoribosyltransferase
MTMIMRCELISWPEIRRLCLHLAKEVKASGFQPDVVIAIGRGGYVPARLICDYMDVMALTSIKIEHYFSGPSKTEKAIIKYPLCGDIKDQKVLLVDDVNDSGDTLEAAIEHLQTFNPEVIRTAVMHHKLTTHFSIDYYARKVVKWRWLIYPWAVFEDITGFLQRMMPFPETLEEAQQRLLEQYDIKIPQKLLRDIYTFMSN